MRRATPVPTRNPACVPLLENYCGTAKFQIYKAANLNYDAIGNYLSSQAATDLANRNPAADQRIMINLDSMRLMEQKTDTMLSCIQSEIIQRQEISSRIYSVQKELENKRKELEEKEQIGKDAKERARLLKDPYSKTTPWESWFPLGRPLKQESVPVLLTISIFFLTLSLGLFLRLAGINLSFHIPFLESGEGFSIPKYRFSVERA
jgi:hypothetical protein